MTELSAELDSLEQQGLLRSLCTREATGGVLQEQAGPLSNFSSNDYLALAHDPDVCAAARDAIERWGTGSTASRLMSGHLVLHEELESELASWTGREAALVFGSGFLTNLGIITALTSPGTVIFEDRLNHASLIDAARLSGARLVRYRHNDVGHLATLLGKHDAAARRLVVTDSLFSMDGDIAQLEAIGSLCDRTGAWLIVDEAHAMGAFGEQGCGCCAGLPPAAQPFAITGTFSKSLGGYGGFVAGGRSLRNLLVNRARSFIYSTGLPPASAAAALAAIRVVRRKRTLGIQLLDRAARFRSALTSEGLDTAPSCSQIIPVMLGGNERAVAASDALFKRSILCTAIRPPTVPKQTARLRFSVTLGHSESLLTSTAAQIAAAVKEVS